MHRDGILLREKQADIILLLKGSQDISISGIAKATGTTYVHVSNFLSECEKLGITSSERHGRSKSIKLSEKGMKLAELISAVSAYTESPKEIKAPS
jgi:predicted transcriptional regulator